MRKELWVFLLTVALTGYGVHGPAAQVADDGTPMHNQGRRPFYVIGHNTNLIANVLEVLAAGANAVEPDIQWDPVINDLVVAHDPPTPLGPRAPRAAEFLRELGDIARQHPQLALVMLDSKVAGAERGARLLQYAREGLQGTNVNLIISVAHVSMTSLFADIVDQLGPREGLQVDQDDNAGEVADWFWRHGVSNACYGHGDAYNSVAVAVDRGVALKVQKCLPKWIYTYTLSNLDNMRDAIHVGVDGIIVTDRRISDLVGMLQEQDIANRVRLAMRADNPFDPSVSCIRGYTISVYTLDRDDAGTDAQVTFTLQGSRGALQTTITGKHGRFEQGDLNEVSLYGNVGVPITLTVEHDGSGNKPDWLPDVVQVRKTGNPHIYAAGFGDWIKAHQPVTRSLGQSRYWLKVTTDTRENAGTDADIIFIVRGMKGEVQRRVNGARPGLFERGSVDSLFITGSDVGPVTSVSVFNDGSGDSPRWFLNSIEVHKDLSPRVECIFDRWVNASTSATATCP